VPGLTWKQSRAKRQAWRGFLHPKESDSTKNRIFALVSTGVSMLGIVAAQTTIYLPGQGRGATASQLLDLRVSKVAAGQLLIGASCTPRNPCNARVGPAVSSITASAVATLSGGTGTAYIYVDSNGLLTVGHALSLACSSGCRALSGIAAFPADSIPLFTWTATNGVWDDSGGSDLRAVFANSVAGVPYTGATSDVNLGTHKLMAAQPQSGDGVNPGLDLVCDPTGTYCQGWGARVNQALSLTYLYPAGTPPSAGQVMRFGVPGGGISQTTWGNAEDPANKGQANGGLTREPVELDGVSLL
jgi:hypothetical protein